MGVSSDKFISSEDKTTLGTSVKHMDIKRQDMGDCCDKFILSSVEDMGVSSMLAADKYELAEADGPSTFL